MIIKGLKERVKLLIWGTDLPIGLATLMMRTKAKNRSTVQSYANRLVNDGEAIKLRPVRGKSTKVLYIKDTKANRHKFKDRLIDVEVE